MRGSSTLSGLLQCALFPLPWPLRRVLLNAGFGFKIARGARVGFSVLRADKVSLAEGAIVGHLTLVKGLAELTLHRHAHVGNLNWISGMVADSAFFRGEPDRVSALEIEEHSSVSNRHYLDCTNRIRIGAFSTFAGVRSQILTHSLDLEDSQQSSAPVTIGRFTFLGTGSILLKGAVLADYCVLGAGSVLRTADTEEYCLWSGVPAQKIRSLDKDWKYFRRTEGFVV